MYGKPSPKGSGNGWSGHYKGKYFRSLLELSYIVSILERFQLQWESAEQKKFRIKYIDEVGETRNYYADFVINEKYLVECKPKNLQNSERVLAKEEFAEKFCLANNLKYKIVDIPRLSDDQIDVLHDNGDLVFIDRYEEKYKNRKEIS